MSKQSPRGFTMVELLVSIAIIAILTAAIASAFGPMLDSETDSRIYSGVVSDVACYNSFYNSMGRYPYASEVAWGQPLTAVLPSGVTKTFCILSPESGMTVASNNSALSLLLPNQALADGGYPIYSAVGNPPSNCYVNYYLTASVSDNTVAGNNVAVCSTGSSQAGILLANDNPLNPACASTTAVGSQCCGGVVVDNTAGTLTVVDNIPKDPTVASCNNTTSTGTDTTPAAYGAANTSDTNTIAPTSTTDGSYNTQVLVSECTGGVGHCNAPVQCAGTDSSDPNKNDAALFCRNSSQYGYFDWFLPASGQLTEMYNAKAYISGLAPSGYYWSSTQDATVGKASMLNIADGTITAEDKTATHFDRCFRTCTTTY